MLLVYKMRDRLRSLAPRYASHLCYVAIVVSQLHEWDTCHVPMILYHGLYVVYQCF